MVIKISRFFKASQGIACMCSEKYFHMISRVFYLLVGGACILIGIDVFIGGEFYFQKYRIKIGLGDEKNIVSTGLILVGVYIFIILIRDIRASK